MSTWVINDEWCTLSLIFIDGVKRKGKVKRDGYLWEKISMKLGSSKLRFSVSWVEKDLIDLSRRRLEWEGSNLV